MNAAFGHSNGRLWYPRNEGEDRIVRVSLYDVRAAEDLRIGYDFDRDGWTIARDNEPERELAFIHAWADQEPAPASTTGSDRDGHACPCPHPAGHPACGCGSPEPTTGSDQ